MFRLTSSGSTGWLPIDRENPIFFQSTIYRFARYLHSHEKNGDFTFEGGIWRRSGGICQAALLFWQPCGEVPRPSGAPIAMLGPWRPKIRGIWPGDFCRKSPYKNRYILCKCVIFHDFPLPWMEGILGVYAVYCMYTVYICILQLLPPIQNFRDSTKPGKWLNFPYDSHARPSWYQK